MLNEHNAFPFPGYDLALNELRRDYVYSKIDHIKEQEIVDMAWQIGTTAAIKLKNEYDRPYDFREIAKSVNLEIIDEDIDRVIGNHRFFSEYITKQSKIFMYLKSINLWAQSNSLSQEQAYNLVLAHEFFHFLEYKKLGYTSKKVLVPIIKIGKFTFGKTGVRALSEIAAHAFVYEIFAKGVQDE